MIRSFISTLIVAVFAWTFTEPVIALTLKPIDEIISSSASHADGIPCPDGDDHAPCDSGCSCLCCPGHATMIITPVDFSLGTPHFLKMHRIGHTEAYYPSGIHNRIFRPPRV